MKTYKQGDPEYISNGHYRIDNVEYMSVWKFKDRYNITPNSNTINGNNGIELFNRGITSKKSKPDFGNFDFVLVYPISDLLEFYNS